jgi:hypothetical protein
MRAYNISTDPITEIASSQLSSIGDTNDGFGRLTRVSSTRALLQSGGQGWLIANGTPLSVVSAGFALSGYGASNLIKNCLTSSPDGSFVTQVQQIDIWAAASCVTISGDTVTSSGNSAISSIEGNLPHGTGTSTSEAPAMTNCYLRKEGDFHICATVGLHKNPQRQQPWGMIYGFKSTQKMIFGGCFYLPSTTKLSDPLTHIPILLTMNGDSQFICTYSNTSNRICAVTVNRVV